VSNFLVRKVAVLGAGVMGAQIAAHCVNARVPVLLFDLPDTKSGNKNGIVLRAIENLKKLSPAPLGKSDDAAYIEAANYEEHLELLKGCDVVIEAIAERMDWKHDLYRKVTPFIAPGAIFASNTSGLSINRLAEAFDAGLRKRFCGVHFFNPPRYMHLVELVPSAATDAAVLDSLEAFLTSTLGKGVLRAKDTPNFIANRIGSFFGGTLQKITVEDDYTIEEVDALTGSLIGLPNSASFRLMDIVGLDVWAHVARNLYESVPEDPWRDRFRPSHSSQCPGQLPRQFCSKRSRYFCTSRQ